MNSEHIRNFSIIAHVDHGKSTLADRLLERTGTIPDRLMRDQFLDRMDLERERGITIKMQPVRMVWSPNNSDRRSNAELTQKDAEGADFLYSDLTYKIRGVLFMVRKNLGLGHKEQIYHNALEIEFEKVGLAFDSKKNISLLYDGKHIGTYQPDFIIENKVLIELKALPEIGRAQTEQVWSYLKGCGYRLALLVNFGSKDLEIKRIVYDSARSSSALSAFATPQTPADDTQNSQKFESHSGIIPRYSALSLRNSAGVSNQVESESYILNLIDTPGHIDFSYEVSRALHAVEGVLLLVDSTQGVQAQTLTTLAAAKSQGCTIVPIVSKIDSQAARVSEVKSELAKLLQVSPDDVLAVSGKTGEGVDELLKVIVEKVPPPRGSSPVAGDEPRGLIFDFSYSTHRGIAVYLRVFDGMFKKGQQLAFRAAGKNFIALETGIFTPEETPSDSLSAGEIGYIVTGIKEEGVVAVGDTIGIIHGTLPPLPGYSVPRPVVWASVYPEEQNDLPLLRKSLERLRLSDSSLSFEEESSGVLGRGFRCGFLGLLHLEIVTERLRREFNLTLIVTIPTISYVVTRTNGSREVIYTPAKFPEHGDIIKIEEPWAKVIIITPPDSLNTLIQLLYEYEANTLGTETYQDGRIEMTVKMPLRELMRGFFDKLKNISSGYASLSYEILPEREADVVRLDILVAEETVPAFARVVATRRAQEEAEKMVKKLHSILPKQLFNTKIQAKVQGRIISSRTLSAMRKDVTGYLYGGDVSRKMKLLQKQKRGKKKMLERGIGKVNIPEEVFMKMVKSSSE